MMYAAATVLAVLASASAQYQPRLLPCDTCDDITPAPETNAPKWYDADGPEYDCDWYTPDNCRLYGDDERYRNFGLLPIEACCVCGGGNSTPYPVAPVPATCNDQLQPGTNASNTTDAPEAYWEDSDGFKCDWYGGVPGRCERYGDQYRNYDLTANEACCKCNGGKITEGTNLPQSAPSSVWDLQKERNELDHNTAFLAGGTRAVLVLRRGQSLQITGNSSAIAFSLRSLYVGFAQDFPLESSTSNIRFRRNSVHTISLPVNLPVGRFLLLADGQNLGEVVVLFNPWSQKDTVYMSDSQQRDNYVKATTTKYFAGNVYGYPRSLSVSASTWRLDTGLVLDDVLDLLNYTLEDWEQQICPESELEASFIQRMNFSDPIMVSRAMSYMGQSSAPHGIVWGRWDGEYEDGETPGFWSGTKQLMDKWKENGHRPVKYGQCWVFGNTLTTFMRALGIPARVISNFNSAHDVPQGFMRTAYGFEPAYDWVIDEDTADSVWNFHVWVNVWFTRPDLDAKGLGLVIPHPPGWNDIDSTPQELSRGLYQLGPANHDDLKANIAVGNTYDHRFLMGEYNARHRERGDEYVGRYTMTQKYNEPNYCGSSFRINSVRSWQLNLCTNDITSETKPAEPSNPPPVNRTLGLVNGELLPVEESEDFEFFFSDSDDETFFIDDSTNATSSLMRRRRRRSIERAQSNVLMTDEDAYAAHDYHLSTDTAVCGEDIVLEIDSHHDDFDMRQAKVDIKLDSIEYTGFQLQTVTVLNGVGTEDSKKMLVTIPFEEYESALSKSLDFRVTSVIVNQDTSYVEHLRLSLEAPVPEVTITAENEVSVSWTNPLPTDLEDVRIIINGPDGWTDVVEEVVLSSGETQTLTAIVPCGRDSIEGDGVAVATLVTSSVAFQHSNTAIKLNC